MCIVACLQRACLLLLRSEHAATVLLAGRLQPQKGSVTSREQPKRNCSHRIGMGALRPSFRRQRKQQEFVFDHDDLVKCQRLDCSYLQPLQASQAVSHMGCTRQIMDSQHESRRVCHPHRSSHSGQVNETCNILRPLV